MAAAAVTAATPASAASRAEVVETVEQSVVVVRAGSSEGSAFAFGRPGDYLTNAHVVGDNRTVQILGQGGLRASAQVIAIDRGADVAKLHSSLGLAGLPALRGAPRAGDDVLAVGSPAGLSGPVTKGIVSAVRSIDGRRMIQTDVAVNPGNSGGPLVTSDGAVVGVTTSRLDGREGIAFAIPIADAAHAVDGLRADQSPAEAPASFPWLAVGLSAFGLVALSVLLIVRLRGQRPAAVVPIEDEPLIVVRRRRGGA
jgi:S1-C subfamily serine protease